ncbi:hypothetical protein [Bacteroides congonensis]|jgi:hypothetical protein|uniref:hypothetical protein n=1 Tax=Bacteroides congonensis TaxID=1871006 RepID=UPI0025A47B0A|nr:hypothetical protein [Bacteroides congonensis]
MGLCDEILKKAITIDCDNPITKGLEANGVIINRQDIDFSATVFDATRKNIIKTLVLKTGKKGYEVYCPGSTPFTGTKTSLEKGTYKNKWTVDLPLVVLDNGPEVCEDVIEGLANGEYVVILRNKHKGSDGNAEYQVYGYYQGLRAETIENDKYSEDTDGGWSVALKETGAPKAGIFFFNTDKKTTDAQFETLTGQAAA